MTRNEILYSLNKPDDFILAIVEFVDDTLHQVRYLRQPFGRELATNRGASVMTDFLDRWADENDANAKMVAEELLIAEVTEAIWESMEDANTSKTELAQRMGATKGHVSQVLSGSRNMTLRTLADICHALKLKPAFSLQAMS